MSPNNLADSTNQTPTSALAEIVESFTGRDGMYSTAIASVVLFRHSAPTEPTICIDRPALCIVVQGSRQVMSGETIYRCDPDQYLVVSTNLPAIVQVIDATPETPCLGLHIDFESAQIGETIIESGLYASRVQTFEPGLFVSQLRNTTIKGSNISKQDRKLGTGFTC